VFRVVRAQLDLQVHQVYQLVAVIISKLH
jgi:hypothetical protein